MIMNTYPLDSEGSEPAFDPGCVVRHKRYGYRGVVVEADAQCKASDAWYEKNQTQPSREQPWYHVLVDGSGGATTYPAQENLELDLSGDPIEHPWLEAFFSGFEDGRYIRNDQPWPSES